MENKILNKISVYKKNKKKIVLCHGVFDLLHVGHVTYFEQAKKLGDILVVSVTDDKYVNKGPLRPVFNINQRTSLIKKLSIVDFVVKSDFQTAKEVIEKTRLTGDPLGFFYHSQNFTNTNDLDHFESQLNLPSFNQRLPSPISFGGYNATL